jgi:hypothetical protein
VSSVGRPRLRDPWASARGPKVPATRPLLYIINGRANYNVIDGESGCRDARKGLAARYCDRQSRYPGSMGIGRRDTGPEVIAEEERADIERICRISI